MIQRKRICDSCQLPILPVEEYVRTELSLIADDPHPSTGSSILASQTLDQHIACALEKGSVDNAGLHVLKGGRA